MNEMLESVVHWCELHECAVKIDIYSNMGGQFLKLFVYKRGKDVSYEFYISGGVFSLQNWRNSNCHLEAEELEKKLEKEMGL